MGTKPTECADAIGVERQSFHRLEKNWWTLSAGEISKLADVIGVKPSQFWFPPPKAGQERLSIDDLLQDMPEDLQKAAVMAVRGMAGK